jgi:hypothetical protein
MILRVTLFLLLALAVALALLAYTNPANIWRWTILMSLCGSAR